MQDHESVNQHIDHNEEWIRISADLRVPKDPIKHLIKELTQKYGEEEAMAKIEKARRHLAKTLSARESHD